jgi:hypothetical protein
MNSMATELERRIAQLIVENRFSCWLVDREIVDGAEMFEAVQASRPAEVRLGELAYSRGWLAQVDVQRILDIQESTGERFGAIGRRLDLLTERQLALLLAEQSECSDILKGQLVDSGLLNLEEVEVLFSQFVDERDQRLNAPLNASASTSTSLTAGNT